MSQTPVEPPHLPPAPEEQVRSHAAELAETAASTGIAELAFTGPGRLRGHISRGHDPFATFRFKRAASELLSAEIDLFSDEVRRNDHLTSDLITASPL